MGPSPALIELVRQETFSASHRLYNSSYDDAWNERVYGACSRPNGHGHNYVLEVSITGNLDPATGMIMNLIDLKAILKKVILDKVDHYHLNHDVSFLQGIIPTTENLALAFWKELDQVIPQGMLYRLRLWETSKNMVQIGRSSEFELRKTETFSGAYK